MAERLDDIDVDDAHYNEEADDDFNPAGAASDDNLSSSDDDGEDTGAAPPKKGRPRKRKSEVLDGDLDSGDEATIQERAQRRKRKKKGKDGDATPAGDDAEESGGEGGFIRTRAQRQVEKQERKERKRGARVGAVTVDVDALWEELSSAPIGRPPQPPTESETVPNERDAQMEGEANKENAPQEDLVTIKRRIEYAGDVTEVEEQVPRSSKEAQVYLAAHPEADPKNKSSDATSANVGKVRLNDQGVPLMRPLRKLSLFEPNPTGLVKGVDSSKLRLRAPSRLDVLMAEKREEAERKKKAEKMTTMGKSALDWKAYVEAEGLGEEMEAYAKGKGGFLERENFLGRAQVAQENRGREARLKGWNSHHLEGMS